MVFSHAQSRQRYGAFAFCGEVSPASPSLHLPRARRLRHVGAASCSVAFMSSEESLSQCSFQTIACAFGVMAPWVRFSIPKAQAQVLPTGSLTSSQCAAVEMHVAGLSPKERAHRRRRSTPSCLRHHRACRESPARAPDGNDPPPRHASLQTMKTTIDNSLALQQVLYFKPIPGPPKLSLTSVYVDSDGEDHPPREMRRYSIKINPLLHMWGSVRSDTGSHLSHGASSLLSVADLSVLLTSVLLEQTCSNARMPTVSDAMRYYCEWRRQRPTFASWSSFRLHRVKLFIHAGR